MVETCNDRAYYRQTGTSQGTVYLYRWVPTERGLRVTSTWDFGPDACSNSDIQYAEAEDEALTPDLIEEMWYEVFDGHLEENTALSTRCK